MADAAAAGGPSAIVQGVLDAARQIAMRFYQLGGTMSGTCMYMSGDDTQEMSMPRDHKEFLDALRRGNPSLYATLRDISVEFAAADSSDQLGILRSAIARVGG